MINKKNKLIIGIGTLKRPKMVRSSLDSLSCILLPSNYEVELVLTDNDPCESAKTLYFEYRRRFSYTLTYLNEKKRGIVYMRNSILKYAQKKNTSLLAFIDDDEIVQPNWLIEMIKTKEKHHADVVVGRVSRLLPDDCPNWIKKGKFFERPNIPTGTLRKSASTSNVLFDFKLLIKDYNLKFHPALNLSGSSDTYMFALAAEYGAKIVWFNGNLVHELVPASRMTVKWLLGRAFRHNNCRTLRKRLKYSYPRIFLTESIYGFLHFLLAFLSLPVNIFRGKAGLVHTLRFLYKGLGSFAGLGGIIYKEYEEIHGY